LSPPVWSAAAGAGSTWSPLRTRRRFDFRSHAHAMKPSHPERSEGSLCRLSAGAAPFAVKGADFDLASPPSLTIVILNEAPRGAPSAPQRSACPPTCPPKSAMSDEGGSLGEGGRNLAVSAGCILKLSRAPTPPFPPRRTKDGHPKIKGPATRPPNRSPGSTWRLLCWQVRCALEKNSVRCADHSAIIGNSE
jgi:hypothetical protein